MALVVSRSRVTVTALYFASVGHSHVRFLLAELRLDRVASRRQPRLRRARADRRSVLRRHRELSDLRLLREFPRGHGRDRRRRTGRHPERRRPRRLRAQRQAVARSDRRRGPDHSQQLELGDGPGPAGGRDLRLPRHLREHAAGGHVGSQRLQRRTDRGDPAGAPGLVGCGQYHLPARQRRRHRIFRECDDPVRELYLGPGGRRGLCLSAGRHAGRHGGERRPGRRLDQQLTVLQRQSGDAGLWTAGAAARNRARHRPEPPGRLQRGLGRRDHLRRQRDLF